MFGHAVPPWRSDQGFGRMQAGDSVSGGLTLCRRIHVTGNAGSGKTTLAAEIGRALDLPVFGLDAIVWRPGWLTAPPDERAAAEAALIARPRWVIDGVSRRVREAADVVIFLDVDRRTCLMRCAGRNWRYLFRSRPGLPDNCPEILIVPRLVRIIRDFPRFVRPGILSELDRRGGAFLVRTAADRAAMLEALRAKDRNLG